MEFFIIIVLVIVNGIFSMSEIALVSARKSRLEEQAAKGSRGAKTALELSQEPEKLLSTVQIGITLIGIVLGAYGGAAFIKKLTPHLEQISWVSDYAHAVSSVIVIGIITYLSLILGELVPKTIGLNHPERIAIALSAPMQLMAKLTLPLVAFLSFSTRLFLSIMMIKPQGETPVTEEELKMMIEKGSAQGVLEKQESEMLQSVFKFNDRRAYSVMTPRRNIEWIDLKDPVEKLRHQILSSPYTKFPVCDGSVDQVVGIITLKDFICQLELHKRVVLAEIMIEPVFVHENIAASQILETFRLKGVHVAIVLDEYGSTEGLITLHDLIEHIVGDLPDLQEMEEQQIFQRADGSWLIDGATAMEQVRELLQLKETENTPTEFYSTVAGFVMNRLNKVPQTGDTLHLDGYKFEIVDMDGRRVDKILAEKEQQETRD